MTIAQTINRQIRTLDPMAFMAWGVKELVNNGNGLQFKSTGMCRWKGWVDVKYNESTDLYDIDFFRIRGGILKMDRKVTDVFAEDLVHVINQQVG